jgi:xylulokinase
MFDGPMAFTGASLKWFRDQFAGPEMLIAPSTGTNEFDLICAQAERVPPGSHGLLYHPYLGTTLAPNWNSNAAGSFFGIRMTTTRSDFIRAVIEGVAFDVYSNVKIAQNAGATIDKLILNGGPTKSRLWNTITSNVTNLPLEVPDIGEAAPLGDAILAAVGAGIYPDPISPLGDIVSIKETIEPDPKLHQMYEDLFGLWTSVYNNLKEDMNEHRRLINQYNLS